MTNEETMAWEEIQTNDEFLTCERALIGSILISEKCFAEIIDIVTASDFYTHICAEIFSIAHDLYTNGGKVDAVAISSKMQELGNSDALGYMRDVMLETPTANNAMLYAEGVRKSSRMRKIRELLSAAIEENKEPDALTDAIMDGLYALERSSKKGKARPLKDAIHAFESSAMEINDDTRLYTKWSRLDKILGGLKGGNFVILAARPSVGKSAMAAEVALRTAEKGIVSAFFSCEMAEEELVERHVANRAKIDLNHVLDRSFKDDKDLLKKYMDMRNEVIDQPLYIYDEANITVNDIRRNLQTIRDVGLVVIDYLQLMHTVEKSENRNLEVAKISKSLKQLAKEYDIPIIALSQLSRDKSEYDEPTLRDLRDSGAIEQDADKVVFLWKIEDGDERILPKVGAKVGKNRNGKLGVSIMRFQGEYMAFYETDEEYVPKRRGKGRFKAYGGHDPDLDF